MADKMTKEQRHNCMASIRSKNTRPELLVRRFLFAHGFRFRIHVKQLPGSPDIVLVGLRTAIFVNGCFWHGHEGCGTYSVPKSNVEFWTAKIERNKQRDKEERLKLRDMGWHVIQIWECELRPKVRERNLQGLLRTLNKILLENKGVHLYNLDEDDADRGLIAAEGKVVYGYEGDEENEGC